MLTPGQTGWGDPLAFSMSKSSLQRALANSFLAGEPYLEQLVSRASRTLGRDWRWLRSLAHRYLKRFAGQTRPRHRDVVRFLNDDSGFRRAWLQNHSELTVAHWVTEPPRMQPVAAAESWKIPSISSAGDLAAWLGLSIGELQWFEDVRRLVYKEGSSKLRHYHYRVVAKQFGAVRLIEAPKPRLKTLQRQILSQILEQIPAHPAAHGFIKGRSIKTFVSPHVGRRVILRMDLQDFFPSFAAARIQALFRTFGYPESVANGREQDSMSVSSSCRKHESCIRTPTYHRARRRLQLSLTCARIGSTADCVGSRRRLEPRTRAMLTTWHFPETHNSSKASSDSQITLPPLFSKKDLPCTSAKLASCAGECGST